METSNGRPTQDVMEFGDWRALQERERIVNKIMDTLKRHLPLARYERLQELKKIAKRVEDEVYTATTSQSEYSRMICLNLLTMETRLQNAMSDSMNSNSSAIRVNNAVPFYSTKNGGGWQAEVYQKINNLKDRYLLDLRPTKAASDAFGDPTMEYGDWRAKLQADSRERIVNKILNTLKMHLPYSGDEGLQELKEIAVRFEKKIYAVATSQSDYLRKISLKMLTMENRSQNPMSNPMQSNYIARGLNPSNTGYQMMQQLNNQRQQLPIPVPSNNIQQMMSQSMHMHNNIVSTSFQASSSLSSTLPPGRGLQQPTMAYVTGQTSNSQNIQNMSTIQRNQLIGQQYKLSDLQQPSQPSFGDPTMESGDWRAPLQADSRQRIVNKILDTLKKHIRYDGHEGLQELKKIAVTFEEKIYTVATSQHDYLRKISLKMLNMETRS